MNPLPQGLQNLPPHELQLQHAYHDDEGLQAARFEARLGDGSVRRGTTDAAGHLRLPELPPGPVQVRFDADGRLFERRDDTPNDRPADLQTLMDRHGGSA
ncbi:carboxypeptidase-like regulatory domain-containing protein [Caldimonas caldifontis]|uniref:Uncharacterized protein n=1 Tax=Caldimonas caldifontis TaxID=1452508 RepID=A0A2S5SSY1_9BURK|nr:carboxypeptidase-like regulatory domain-containing protein [Caldimonas caldifontis]PPE65845.1 hypothetical protein C1704_13110 [Caldimonas caldifontis]